MAAFASYTAARSFDHILHDIFACFNLYSDDILSNVGFELLNNLWPVGIDLPLQKTP